MLNKALPLLLFYVFSAAAAETTPLNAKKATAEPPSYEWAISSNQFGLNLYKTLQATHKNNFCISPFGISSAVTLLYLGAAGESQGELRDLLNFPKAPPDPQNEFKEVFPYFVSSPFNFPRDLNILNISSLWVASKFSLLNTYQEMVQRDYKSSVRRVDFTKPTASYEINRFFKERSEGKLDEMIPSKALNASDRLVAGNFFTLKAKWDKEIVYKQVPSPFFINEDTTLAVPSLMASGNIKMFEEGSVAIVQLPYELSNKKPRLNLLLVYSKKKKELDELKKKLSHELLMKWSDQLTMRHAIIFFPKFHINEFVVLNSALEKIGMKIVFSNAADFTKITAQKGLKLSQVFHKAVFRAALNGTEESLSDQPYQPAPELDQNFHLLRIDHPFLFLVQDKTTGAILVIGQVVNPMDNVSK